MSTFTSSGFDATRTTKAVLDRYVQATLRGDVDAIMEGFTEDTILCLPDGPIHGLSAIREFFEGVLGTPEQVRALAEHFEIIREDVEGQVGYLVWKAEPSIALATDTFVVQDDRIAVHTFAAHVAN